MGISAVTLINPYYYTVPAVKDLHFDSGGHCWVEDFVIGHRTFGSARFPGITNVAGLDLDAIGKEYMYHT